MAKILVITMIEADIQEPFGEWIKDLRAGILDTLEEKYKVDKNFVMLKVI